MEPTKTYLSFKLLLEAVSATFQESYKPSSTSMADWKGTDILQFQEDLRTKVGSTVSEKWFYTYVKNESDKLPRIDILNLLSAYSGHSDWNTFKSENQITKNKKAESFQFPPSERFQNSRIRGYLNYKTMVQGLLLAIMVTIGLAINRIVTQEITYEVCIVDYYDNLPIKNAQVTVLILQKNESPIYLKTDSLSCFKTKTSQEKVTFILSSPYHKTDTVTKFVTNSQKLIIPLQTDDYALMLDYYANKDRNAWQKRKNKLNTLISNEAIIMELLPFEIGVSLYDKKDFIEKLTTPTAALKKLEILETSYHNKQIQKIKFRMKS